MPEKPTPATTPVPKPAAKAAPSVVNRVMAKQFVDEQTFRSLVRLSTFSEVIGLVAAGGSFALFATVRQTYTYSIAVAIIMAIGLIYNLLIWRRWHSQRPLLAIQFAILPPIISILIVALATGGVKSPWYPIWYIALVCSGITGTRSVYYTAGLTAGFYGFSWYIAQRLGGGQLAGPVEALASVAALVAGYMIGRGVNRMVKTMQVAESLTKQLDGAEMKQQLMMSSIADAVVAVDTERKVVIFNEAAQEITGWDQKTALGVEYNLIYKLKDMNDAELTATTDPFLQVLKTGRPSVSDNLYMLNRENQKLSFSISIAPTLNGRNQVNGAIAVFHDISDQKQLARERNEFISTASHEMRTPVAAIEGYLSMAMNDNLATVDDRAKNFISKAHDSSLHLGKLFKDLLSVTKIEDNRMIINRRDFNFSELVTQVASEMEIIAKQKNLRLLTHVGSGGVGKELVVAPVYQVNADPDRIREVLANLIDNAIKYTREGTIDITLKADKRFVTVSVSDQGIGISAAEQKHLFQKFYRVNNSFTRDVGGTGLGLYIARSLVERFGGRIWVESSEGRGSTFSFTLPIKPNS